MNYIYLIEAFKALAPKYVRNNTEISLGNNFLKIRKFHCLSFENFIALTKKNSKISFLKFHVSPKIINNQNNLMINQKNSNYLTV